MIKRTLLVLEPGGHPEALIHSGLAVARSCLAEAVFYTVLDGARPPQADLAGAVMVAHWASLDDGRLLTERLHAQARQLALDLDLRSRSVIETGNDPVRRIIDTAQATCCDMIVANSEPSNAVMRLLNGSLIPGLVTASPIPVLVYPSHAAQASARRTDIRRILVLLGDSDTQVAARTQGLDLARATGADLLFAHVTPSGLGPVVDAAGIVSTMDDWLGTEIQRQSQRLVASACRRATRMGLTARGRRLAVGTTGKDIAGLAVDEDCDLIVLGHHGRNAVMRLLSGSLIPGLITSAPVPVLICREAATPPKRREPRRRRHRHRGAEAAAVAPAIHVHAG